MESNKIKSIAKSILIILIPLIISLLASLFLIKPFHKGLLWFIYILSSAALFCLIFSFLSEAIEDASWELQHKKVLKKSIIGIIKEDTCAKHKSKFNPEDWKRILEENFNENYTIKSIGVSEISNKYVAILNPYGEGYPEEDFLYNTSFRRIREYVRNGGIFVNIAGLAFWYACDIKTGHTSFTHFPYG